MGVPYFVNPTAGGRIQPHLENWDGTSIRVTRTCGPCGHAGSPHSHSAAEGCAVDLGDARCTRPVVAAMAGTVLPRDASQILQGIVRIVHADGWETHYSHMYPVLVKGGDVVAQAQQIGEIGDAHDPAVTQFSGCHLHYNVLHNGAQQDPAGYLNMPPPPPPAVGGDMLQGTNPVQIHNRTCQVKGDGTRLRAAPAAGDTPILAIYGAGTTFTPDWEVTGADVGGSKTWYGGWGQTAKGLEFGYFHASVLTPPVPAEPTTTGLTEEQVKQRVTDATRPLEERIADIKAKVAAGAVDIADD